MNTYISKDLAAWIKERGCEVEAEMHWQSIRKGNDYQIYTKGMVEQNQNHFYGMGYPAYTYYDILVTHVKEFWSAPGGSYYELWQQHPLQVILFLQKKKIQEAEDYIKKYSVFANVETNER